MMPHSHHIYWISSASLLTKTKYFKRQEESSCVERNIPCASDDLYSPTPPTSSDFPISVQLSQRNTQLMSLCISKLNERTRILLLHSLREVNIYVNHSKVSPLVNSSFYLNDTFLGSNDIFSAMSEATMHNRLTARRMFTRLDLSPIYPVNHDQILTGN